MAARTASAQFLTAFRRSAVRSFQPVAVPRQATEDVARSTYGGLFANRQLHSESQATHDNEDTHEYERSKMTAEGGGSLGSDYGEKAAEVSQRGQEATEQIKSKVGEKSAEVGEKSAEVTDEAKGQVSKNVDTAKDMFKDFPQKVSDTATGLKEVGVEAAKAVKRDTSKVAEKAGLKSDE